jgi:PRTRC genetic system protein B
MTKVNLLKRQIVPLATLVVYEQEEILLNKLPYEKSSKEYYLETRPVRDDGTLGPAKPVSREFIKSLVMAFRAEGETIPHGRLPGTLLYADSRMGLEKYVWWNPPCKRGMFFTKDIPMKDGDYNVPGTIYMVKDGRLSVFCFAGKKPRPETHLLYGPFYNYYKNGDICLGNAKDNVQKPADPSWEDILAYWEKLFWGSENAHIIHNPMEKGYNLNTVLKGAMNAPFPTETLQKTGKTLKSLLE